MPEEVKDGQQQPAADDNQDSKEAVAMKGGDYMIHVYIQSGKNFKSGHDTICPMIQISCCGIEKYSASKSDVPTGTDIPLDWSEHMFFEPRNQRKEDIEVATISIRVLNKGLFRDDLIGSYDFDITFVYFKDKHTIQHQWIALNNPESDDFSEISGYLKLSINVQGPGDEQVQLDDQSGADAADAKVMMPASIKKEFKQLKFRFIHAEKLPQMDMFGSIDAYWITHFMGKKSRTKAVTQKKEQCPVEQEIWLPIQWPLSIDRLVFKVYDEDKVVDELVCSMKFSLKEIVARGSNGGYTYWHNLYGAPKDGSGDGEDMMKENPELASAWQGRVLMNIEVVDSKHPVAKVEQVDPAIKQKVIDEGYFNPQEYEIMMDVGMGVQLPGKEKYGIKVLINDFEVDTSKSKESREGYCRWHERINKTFQSAQQSIDAMENIFVYLMKGSKPISYWKGHPKDFTDPNPEYKWLTMKADKAIGEIDNDYDAGLISLKLTLHHKQKYGPLKFNDYDAWKKPPPRRLAAWKVRCHIYQCKDIPSADEDGSCDPFISIWNPDGKDIKTKSITDSLNPIIYEVLEVYYDYDDIKNAPPIILNVWDFDDELIGSSKDYLGRAVIYLKDCKYSTNDDIIEPEWHDIKLGFDESSPSSGQVLVAFSVVNDDYDWKVPSKYLKLSDYVPTQEYQVDINVLGLRDLQSFGLMPIKKPFINFRVKSLLPPEKAEAVTNVKTDPNASGANPNINTMISMSVMLPRAKLYCPRLSCDAYDYVFKGLSQPLIGTFTIPIGDIMHQQQEERESMIRKATEILTYLKQKAKEDPHQARQKIAQKKQAQQESQQAYDSRQSGKGGMRNSEKPKPSLLQQEPNPFDAKRGQSQGINRNMKKGRGGYMELDEDLEAQNAPNIDADRRNQLGIDIDGIEEVKDDQIMNIQDIDLQMQKIESTVNKQAKKSRGSRKSAKSLTQQFDEKKKLAQEKQNQILQRKATLKDQKLADQKAMKDAGISDSETILCPQYEYNNALKHYVEVKTPPETIYKAVGFNDLQIINKMMDGDDEEKRQKEQFMSTQKSLKRTPTSILKNKQAEAMKENADEARMLTMTKKHYRKYYDDELENDKEIFPKMPFHHFDIKRGQSRGAKKSWLSFLTPPKLDESGQVSTEKIVGYFKGKVTVFNEDEKKKFEQEKQRYLDEIIQTILDMHKNMLGKPMQFALEMLETQEGTKRFVTELQMMDCEHPDLVEFLQDQSFEEMIKKQLLRQTPCTVEAYVLEGFDLASRDIGSFSDPYLKISVGERSYNTRDEYKLDEPNPKFNKRFEFAADFPGAPPMIVEAYDYDDLFGDDLIGRTVVDLDDRFFSPDWQAMEEKPIEYRQIYHESTSLSQGVIQMWVEIEANNKEASRAQKAWDVAAEPELDYELRLSVFNTQDVPAVDAEGCSDVYIKAYIDDKDKRETDTHYRCMNGKASFNYRLVYNVKAPRKNYLLVVQAWDRDLFSSNDYICEWTLDLTEIFANVRMTQKSTHVNKKFYNSYFKDKLPSDVRLEFEEDDTFWLTTIKDGQKIKCRFDLRLFPGEMAKANPVGHAREESNFEPFLPPPVGRISFSLNPLSMLQQLVGPAMLRKIYCYCAIAVCAALCIAMLPMIGGNFISLLFFKMLGLQ